MWDACHPKTRNQANRSRPPADYFTGAIRIDGSRHPSRRVSEVRASRLSPVLAPYTHPLGQTLIVIWGIGLAQHWGGAIEEIWAGDVIWFSPGEKHWHGATPMTAMTHIAVQEALLGKVVDWMEHVSEEDEPGPDRRLCPSFPLSTLAFARAPVSLY